MNAPLARVPSDGPQLRTILLTDLVDSTALVERLGDVPASELFREHDRLVLTLQQQWRGRLIDRSDGLLLLFERPIDGLGFALDYTRGLRDIGKSRQIELQARAGLHVGEVLTWKNSDAAVQVGAKPLEVEGLAKPMAARLMTLARPGQILLSAVAEPLARRAARELGERGQNLLWKSYGRWRFKGVPETQEVYEVGEVGIAPLRAPGNNPKAWRDIPLWRRPAALAAEVVLLAGLGIGAWFVTKPQPAIAFAERDWVVVGDLRNLTGQSVLDDSLSQAFRISLEQSRYVNVLSDMKARDTLARMQRQPSTPLDRAIASEIALRDGARAVILPTVSEIGGRVRVSAEVIDPHTQTTVYAESADGTGAGSALDSIDKVTGALRGKLGEALASIEKDSEPLPQVTTKNMDALRAYALGVRAQANGKADEALTMYQRAISFDPQFALAYLGLARVYAASDDSANAIKNTRIAHSLSGHLPPRDQMYAEAWLATFGPVEPMLQKWQSLVQLYPDFFAGHYNVAYFSYALANEVTSYKAAIGVATSEKNPLYGWSYYLRGTLNTAAENFKEADSDFARANRAGVTGAGMSQASSQAARRNFEAAERILEKAKQKGVLEGRVDPYLMRITLAVDQGRWAQALDNADLAVTDARQRGALEERKYRVIRSSLRVFQQPDQKILHELRELLKEETLAYAGMDPMGRAESAFAILVIGYLGGRAGSLELLDEALKHSDSASKFGNPKVDDMIRVASSERMRLSGQPERAVQLLDAGMNGAELYQARVARLRAYAAAKHNKGLLEEARWLSSHRGRAYVEFDGNHLLQALNVADSNAAHLWAAEALIAQGRTTEGMREKDAFERAWPLGELPPYLRERSVGLPSE
ncbi:putative peptide modification system cyclase [Pseudoxanthomonas wuyuanensis]